MWPDKPDIANTYVPWEGASAMGANQRYLLESSQKYATLRGEFVGMWGGGQSSEKATVVQNGDSFKAEIFVPVWTSQLFVSDWWQPAAAPLRVTVHPLNEAWQVNVENHTDQKLTSAQIVVDAFSGQPVDNAA